MKSSYLLTKIFLTGAIVLGLELAASRIMTPFFGVSLYVWSGILSVTLIALALGYKWGGDIAAKTSPDKLLLLYASAGGIAALWVDLCLWTYPAMFKVLSLQHLVVGSIAACFYLLFVPLIVLSGLNPLLVALLSQGKSAGDHGAGRVFFVSTVGSVFGVFAVAYGLLQYLTNYQTVALLALFSALLSIVMLLILGRRGSKLWMQSIILSVAAFGIAVLTLCGGGLERLKEVSFNGMIWKTLAVKPSYFGGLRAVELQKPGDTNVMVLLNDGLIQNTFSGPGISASTYSYALEQLSYAAGGADPKTALVLGVGGGAIPMSFDQAGIAVDAVDINRDIVDMGREHFGFETGNINIIIEDARIAVRHCTKKYDIVSVDLFHADGVPEHLVTREFFADIKSCMNKDAVMTMNTFMMEEHPEPEYALLRTIADVFGGVYFVPGRNAYIVARNGAPVGPLQISTTSFPAALAPPFFHSLSQARTIMAHDPVLKDAPVITDVANHWKHLARPVEEMSRRVLVTQMPWQVMVN